MATVECAFDKLGGLLTKEEQFKKLKQFHDQHAKQLNMRQLFHDDPNRAQKYHIKLEKEEKHFSLLFDYSKNIINDDVMQMLIDLAKRRGVEEKRHAMVTGAKINFTENRAVLHVAYYLLEISITHDFLNQSMKATGLFSDTI